MYRRRGVVDSLGIGAAALGRRTRGRPVAPLPRPRHSGTESRSVALFFTAQSPG